MRSDLRPILGAIFCLYAIQMLVLLLVPLKAVAIGLPGMTVGVLIAVPPGLSLLTDIPVAVASDRIGRRLPLSIGALLGIASGLLLALAPDPITLFLGVTFFAAQMSLSIGPCLAYLTELVRGSEQSRAQGYNGTVQSLGALLAAAVAGVVADRAGLGWAFMIASIASGAVLVLMWRIPETVSRRAAPTPRALLHGYVDVLVMVTQRKRIQLSSLVALTYGAVIFMTGSSFLPVYVVHNLGMSALAAGTLVAVRNVVATAASPVFAGAVSRLPFRSFAVVVHGIGVGGVAAVAFTQDPNVLLVCMALQGVGIAFTPAIANSLIASATRSDERALGFAANGFVMRCGMLVAPIAYGAVLQFVNTRAIFIVAAIVGAIFLIAFAVRSSGFDRSNDELPTRPDEAIVRP